MFYCVMHRAEWAVRAHDEKLWWRNGYPAHPQADSFIGWHGLPVWRWVPPLAEWFVRVNTDNPHLSCHSIISPDFNDVILLTVYIYTCTSHDCPYLHTIICVINSLMKAAIDCQMVWFFSIDLASVFGKTIKRRYERVHERKCIISRSGVRWMWTV